MDLSKFATRERASKGATLHLKSPADGTLLMTEGADPKPVTITVIGQDAKEYNSLRQRLADRRLSDVVKSGGLQAKGVVTSAKLESDSTELAVAATVSWENITWEGKTLLCSPENATMLYNNCPWIMEQVQAFTADRANFLGN